MTPLWSPSAPLSPDVLSLLDQVLEQACTLVGTEHAFLYILSADGEQLELRGLRDVGGLLEHTAVARLSPGEGLSGQVWQSGELVYVADYDTWKHRARQFPLNHIGAMVGFPLREEGQVVGVIGLAFARGRDPGRDLRERLAPFAWLASSLLENAGLRGDLHRANRAQQTSVQRLEDYFSLIPLALIEVDLALRVTRWNAAAEQTFGYSAQEALGASLAGLIVDPETMPELEQLALRMHTENAVRHVNPNRHKDGRALTCEWYNIALRDAAGQVYGVAGVGIDISASRRAEARVRVLEAATASAGDAILITEATADPQISNILYANAAFCELSGYRLEELLGQTPQLLWDQTISPEGRTLLEQSAEAGVSVRLEVLEARKDGSHYWSDLHLQPVHDTSGQVSHRVSWRRDITHRKRAEMMGAARAKVLEMLLEGARLETVVTELARWLERIWEGRALLSRLDVDRFRVLAAPNLTTQTLSDLDAKDLGLDGRRQIIEALSSGPIIAHAAQTDPAWDCLIELMPELRSSWMVPISAGSGTLLGAINLLYTDVRRVSPSDLELLDTAQQLASLALEHHALQERLEYRTAFDGLTGLPNRTAFERELEARTQQSWQAEVGLTLYLIDLDNFRTINDACGHDVGDAVLHEIGQRLRDTVGHHWLGRIGGDEFAVLAYTLGTSEAQALAQAMLEAVRQPLTVSSFELFASMSIGIVRMTAEVADRSSLMRAVDTALFKAKDAGRDTAVLFEGRMNDAQAARLETAGALRRALEKGEFEVFFQPQMNRLGQPAALEALLRWRRPGRGLVPPSEFIPVAEETGFIIALDTWVLEQTCCQVQALRQHGYPGLQAAVNITAPHFARSDFVQTVREVLERSDLPAQALELELTESVLAKDIDGVAARMRELRTLGIGISIDDFGTGYSSLSYLRKLPLDGLKIDRSFVRDLHESSNRALVAAIVSLAQQFGLHTVAEGVETQDQLEHLLGLGCDRIQGFYYSKPLPLEELRAFLLKWRGGE